jgi:thioredoxin 1
MVERFIMTVVLAVLLLAAYRLFNWWQVRRASAHVVTGFQPGRPAVVLFTADHCAPCKFQQRPALQRLLDQLADIQVIEVDVEADPATAQEWRVMSLPTTYILDKNGKPRGVNHGVTSTEKLRQQVEAVA